MKKNKLIYILHNLILIFCLLPATAAENQVPAKPAETCDLSVIKIANDKRRHFIQKKYIEGLEEPLVAKGYIYLNSNNQLELEMIDPEQYKLIFTPDKLYISNMNDDGSYSKSAVNHEEADHLSNFMISLLGKGLDGDTSDILNSYHLECKTTDSLLIKGELKRSAPQSPVLFFKISGKNRPSIVEITDKDKTRLVIEVLDE